jgi:hypothetical protein
LFGGQLPKFPSRIGRRQPRGRIEYLAGLGLVVWTRQGSPGQRGDAVRIEIGAGWHFSADAHARLLKRMRAPGRPGEPQSTGGEQRHYGYGHMLWFHCLLVWFQLHIHFRYGILRGFPEVGFRFGMKAGNSGAKRQRAGTNRTPFELELANQIDSAGNGFIQGIGRGKTSKLHISLFGECFVSGQVVPGKFPNWRKYSSYTRRLLANG